jgi:hypothetical protein
MVGHLQAVSDPLEDLRFLDRPDVANEFAHTSLADPNCDADPGLADTRELVKQVEQDAHVAFGKSAGDAGMLPEFGRYFEGLERAGPHWAS